MIPEDLQESCSVTVKVVPVSLLVNSGSVLRCLRQVMHSPQPVIGLGLPTEIGGVLPGLVVVGVGKLH